MRTKRNAIASIAIIFTGYVTTLAPPCYALLAPSPLFRVTDLGTFGGTSVAIDINNQGVVVGFSFLPDGVSQRAFRTAPNAAINPATDNLGTLGGIHSAADAINDLGQVVGASYLPDNATLHAFRTSPGDAINSVTDDLGVGAYAQADGINNAGQVVGQFGTSRRAFRTAPNAAIALPADSLGVLPGGGESAAYNINSLGQVTGYSYTNGINPNSVRAIRVEPGSPMNASSNLGTLGGQYSTGHAINDLGQVVGESSIPGELGNHAFRTAPNAAINAATDDLGTLQGGVDSRANDINNLGWIVGQASIGVGYHAFLHTGNGMLDLNDLVDNTGAGWILLSAYAINEHKQIVGQGFHNGVTRAFRLDLIPEPPNSMLAGAAFAVLCLARIPSMRASHRYS